MTISDLADFLYIDSIHWFLNEYKNLVKELFSEVFFFELSILWPFFEKWYFSIEAQFLKAKDWKQFVDKY
jgi:hypothetical protein